MNPVNTSIFFKRFLMYDVFGGFVNECPAIRYSPFFGIKNEAIACLKKFFGTTKTREVISTPMNFEEPRRMHRHSSIHSLWEGFVFNLFKIGVTKIRRI